jgi:hypothetical protein
MPSGRLVGCAGAIAIAAALTACDMGRLTVNTTAKVLKRAQPSLKMESDYELAARAVPATRPCSGTNRPGPGSPTPRP